MLLQAHLQTCSLLPTYESPVAHCCSLLPTYKTPAAHYYLVTRAWLPAGKCHTACLPCHCLAFCSPVPICWCVITSQYPHTCPLVPAAACSLLQCLLHCRFGACYTVACHSPQCSPCCCLAVYQCLQVRYWLHIRRCLSAHCYLPCSCLPCCRLLNEAWLLTTACSSGSGCLPAGARPLLPANRHISCHVAA